MISTPFGFHSTAADVAAGIDLSGRHAIVTGGASGIGIETARALAATGAAVTLAVRSTDAAQPVAADIIATTGNRRVEVARLDLTDLDSVDAFAAAWDGPLHLLINNAGVMALPERQLTRDGWEMQFATNHLGHFALSHKLHRALAADGAARIVSVSSSAHMRSPVVFEDIHFTARAYDPLVAYGQSKTANILFAVGATARWAGDGITCNALMPGGIMTNLQRHIAPEVLAGWRAQQAAAPQFKTPEQGAATTVLLAVSPLLNGIGGRYFNDCNEAAIEPEPRIGAKGVAAYAIDPGNADRLWEWSLEALRIG